MDGCEQQRAGHSPGAALAEAGGAENWSQLSHYVALEKSRALSEPQFPLHRE